MKTVTKTIALVLLSIALPLQAQERGGSLELQELLETVREGRQSDRAEDRERIDRFQAREQERERMLAEIEAEHERLEQVSADMEATFEDQEQQISNLEERLKERMGSLKELFGVLQQIASDTQAQFHVSLTQLDHPARNGFLIDFAGRMGQANRLPEIREIERVWFELQREMTESGRVLSRTLPVVDTSGAEVPREVTRIGLFNAVSDGRYLQFIPETGRLLEYSRQPNSRYLTGPNALVKGGDEAVPFAVDPVRGQLLQILTQAPDLSERIAQGGAIGYTIIGLGIAGLLLALFRLAVLSLESHRVHRQLANLDKPQMDNALGRVLTAAKEDDIPDIETLELRLGEAVLRETPRINAYVPLLKIIAAVAPLMGLLGTVTGMIITFQAITLFGAGDPRLMAGGISQALITTVLGLCVAIPMLLLHNILHMRTKALTEVLQHEAVAVVSAHAEARADNDPRGDSTPPRELAA